MSVPANLTTDVSKQLRALLERAVELGSAITAGAAGVVDDPGSDHDEPQFVADRLTRSVIRPLKQVLEQPDGQPGTLDDAEPAHDDQNHRETAAAGAVAESSAADQQLLGLAQDATQLRALSGVAELQEAAAALQDLTIRQGSDGGEDAAAARRAGFREIMAALPSAIQSERNGPCLVTDAENVVDWLGYALPSAPQMALCRCGQSKLKPLCDGTHAEIGFSAEKDPKRVEDRQDTYVGQQVTILDNRGTCQHSGFCTDRLATAFRAGKEPFVRPSGGRMDEIIRAVRDSLRGTVVRD
jgi:CDGSH-type Zn-finger protein